jgi:mono/diheme cytochrome c family protein
MTRFTKSFFALVGLGTLLLRAADPTPDQVQFFENQIRPILSDKCYACHSADATKVRGGLLLDSREGTLQGGDSGPAVVPGHPNRSLLISAVNYADENLQMPPKGNKLTDREIAALERWVRMGAPDPRDDTAGTSGRVMDGADHWAWQPLRQPAVPGVQAADWCQTPVDNFILARLEAQGIQPNDLADRITLLRRVYFDLIGLPPTPQEVEAFLNDASSKAFSQVIDRLLASPRYGERWGRHWLDVARYSDTKGEVPRYRDHAENPHAYLYRDYVIRSFNEDKPWDQFILEQIAADHLPASDKDRSVLVALGFLSVGDRYRGMRNDIINDQVDVVTKGFLGLTVTCARCHDHKFDPVPQEDYYSLHGIFVSTTEPKVLPVIDDVKDTPEYRQYKGKLQELMREREQLAGEFQVFRKSKTKDPDTRRSIQRRQRKNFDALVELEKNHPGAPRRAVAVEDIAKPRNSRLLIRGEAGNNGPVVQRQFLEVLDGAERQPFSQGSGRLQLARAIASPDNPLTPRVLVNRVWQHHFGEGFVPTPDDLGVMSMPPSHPELLDYLASRFVKEGWSIKKLHRQILLSSTWQQSSRNNPRYTEIDPGNRLLWRQNIRRLEMEPVRDSLLAISGQLQEAPYGKPFDLDRNPQTPRRTVYARIDRQRIPETFIHFDFATPDMVTGRRHVTTVPQQTLFFMNSPMVIELAKKLVGREDFTALGSDQARVELLYQLLYQRQPTDIERALGLDFLESTPAPEAGKAVGLSRKGKAKKGAPKAPLTVWQEYAQALLQANEFVFVN